MDYETAKAALERFPDKDLVEFWENGYTPTGNKVIAVLCILSERGIRLHDTRQNLMLPRITSFRYFTDGAVFIHNDDRGVAFNTAMEYLRSISDPRLNIIKPDEIKPIPCEVPELLLFYFMSGRNIVNFVNVYNRVTTFLEDYTWDDVSPRVEPWTNELVDVADVRLTGYRVLFNKFTRGFTLVDDSEPEVPYESFSAAMDVGNIDAMVVAIGKDRTSARKKHTIRDVLVYIWPEFDIVYVNRRVQKTRVVAAFADARTADPRRFSAPPLPGPALGALASFLDVDPRATSSGQKIADARARRRVGNSRAR
jgi:hypothetical protein